MKIVISNLNNGVTKDDVRNLVNNSEIEVMQIRSVVQGRTGRLITSAHVRVEDRTVGEQLIQTLNSNKTEDVVVSAKEFK
jgi:hypothetical protein